MNKTTATNPVTNEDPRETRYIDTVDDSSAVWTTSVLSPDSRDPSDAFTGTWSVDEVLDNDTGIPDNFVDDSAKTDVDSEIKLTVGPLVRAIALNGYDGMGIAPRLIIPPSSVEIPFDGIDNDCGGEDWQGWDEGEDFPLPTSDDIEDEIVRNDAKRQHDHDVRTERHDSEDDFDGIDDDCDGMVDPIPPRSSEFIDWIPFDGYGFREELGPDDWMRGAIMPGRRRP